MGGEVIAIISVSISGVTTILTTCFHSRCKKISTPCISCEREIKEEKIIESNNINKYDKIKNINI